MRTLVIFLCYLSISWADSQAEETEITSNKITTSKLNSIPSAPAQKPGGAPGQGQSPLFQQAVHQLLSYYNSNPQARLQLLQQQGGIPQNVPQSPLPSGGLHVVPSPHLDQPQASAGVPSGAQHVYAVPAQGQYSLSPALLAQLTAQPAPQQAQTQHLVAQQFPSQHLPAQFIAQQIPAQQFAPQQQYNHQFPAQYTLSPQFASSLQGQNGLGALFGLKSGAQFISANDFATQTNDKSQLSNSNYSPVFRTAYVKG
ncbi:hypothetical protein CBL_01033 [Carabus blaptoides fortunei]